nr:immunoglobulin heavy chain junction region [Mus musculus]MBK4186600.1 immunoglobulin heavy chain junction region [Mus musculus]MBK4186601.1 immunoglobulin heavy chain junction region [Mus musculus]
CTRYGSRYWYFDVW